jgi:hypothetical protein
MVRWMIKLAGERFDLEEFPRWFRSGNLLWTSLHDRSYRLMDDKEETCRCLDYVGACRRLM